MIVSSKFVSEFITIIPNFLILLTVCSTITLSLECFLLYFFSSSEFTFPFLFKWQYILYSGKVVLNSQVTKVKDIFNLQRSCRMFIFEDLIIMYSSPLMICFVQYHTFTVYHVLCLYSMFLPFTGVVAFLLSLVLRPWYFLFSRINESLETRKVHFDFIYSFKLSDTFIQFLRQWDTQFDKWF